MITGNQAQQAELATHRKLLNDRKTSEQIDATIDGIIATHMIDDSGEYQKPDPDDTSGEALAVLALGGDEQAQELLGAKRQQLVDYDKRHNIEDPHKKIPELTPDEWDALDHVTAIHVTRFKPQESADGTEWEIPTTFDAMREVVLPRITWHSSLQERAPEDPMAMGSSGWHNTRYAILSRAGSLIRNNGIPQSWGQLDTFFEISPGERIRISKSDGILIRPGNPVAPDVLYETDSNRHEVRYKHTDFTPDDIKEVSQQFADVDLRRQKDIRDSMIGALKAKKFGEFTVDEAIVRRVSQLLGGEYKPDWYSADFDHQDTSFMARLQERPASEVVADIVSQLDLEEGVARDLSAKLGAGIDRYIASRVKDMAIDAQVRQFKADADLLTDPVLTSAIDKLDIKHGGRHAHTHHPTLHSESTIIRNAGTLLRESLDQQTYHYGGKYKGDMDIEYPFGRILDMRDSSPGLRRMYYYLGLF